MGQDETKTEQPQAAQIMIPMYLPPALQDSALGRMQRLAAQSVTSTSRPIKQQPIIDVREGVIRPTPPLQAPVVKPVAKPAPAQPVTDNHEKAAKWRLASRFMQALPTIRPSMARKLAPFIVALGTILTPSSQLPDFSAPETHTTTSVEGETIEKTVTKPQEPEIKTIPPEATAPPPLSTHIDAAWHAVIQGYDPGHNAASVTKVAAPLAPTDIRPLIVLDLGHGETGGRNERTPGAVSHGLSEIDVVDPIAAELARQLEDKGYMVAFTREPGEALPAHFPHTVKLNKDDPRNFLRARSKFAQTLAQMTGASDLVFVSLHADGSDSPSARGAKALAFGKDGKQEYTNPLSQNLAKSLASNYKIGDLTTTAKSWDKAVLSEFDEAAYGYHKGDIRMSAALLELGHLTNSRDARILQQAIDNPTTIATMITQGITQHLKSTTTKPTQIAQSNMKPKP
jgi:N-acetylmuramoyl-L-alanine amidase